MRYIFPALIISLFIGVASFHPKTSMKNEMKTTADKTENVVVNTEATKEDVTLPAPQPVVVENKTSVEVASEAQAFVDYAKTLIGTPYLYGSVDPTKGLDCSGFVKCVANHFQIKVPRSSVDFTEIGTEVAATNAKPGDLILFTGTDAAKRVVGHMGIVSANHDGEVEFIHSSSGKVNGVTISGLDGYYQTRFMKIVRIFPLAVDAKS